MVSDGQVELVCAATYPSTNNTCGEDDNIKENAPHFFVLLRFCAFAVLLAVHVVGVEDARAVGENMFETRAVVVEDAEVPGPPRHWGRGGGSMPRRRSGVSASSNTRGASRSISPQRGSIRFRPLICTYGAYV